MFRGEKRIEIDNRPKKTKTKKRVRNKIVNFRVSPEEYEILNNQIKISGLLKQDYLIQSLINHKVVTLGNIKSFSNIKALLTEIKDKLIEVDEDNPITNVDIETICAVVEMIEGLGADNE